MAVDLAEFYDRIVEARARIADTIRTTPMKRSGTLTQMAGVPVYLKLESFQRAGSFKVRGAANKIAQLPLEDREKGVVAASAGNHAQGVAIASAKHQIPCTVFMPKQAPLAKIQATRAYGANVVLTGEDYQSAYEAAMERVREQGATFVHAFDDPDVMAGQGTIGLEILEQAPDTQTVVIPVGGGGLCSGVAAAIKHRNPKARIIAVQAEGASTLADSLQKGVVTPIPTVNTIADGIAVRRLGSHTFEMMRHLVDEVVTVSDREISRAIVWLLERSKTTAEGGGAVPLAALLAGKLPNLQGPTCLVISGGNIDMNLVSRIIQRGLVEENRIRVIGTNIPDKPGSMVRLLTVIAEEGGNVLEVRHDRRRFGSSVNETHLEVEIETHGADHATAILQALRAHRFDARDVTSLSMESNG